MFNANTQNILDKKKHLINLVVYFMLYCIRNNVLVPTSCNVNT